MPKSAPQRFRRSMAALVAAALVFGGAAGASAAANGPDEWIVSSLPVPARAAVSYAEPGIVVGAQGRALVAAASANTGAPPTFWLSRDGGRAWDVGGDVDLTRSSTGDADVAIGPDGYLYALNLAYNPNPPAQPANPTVLVFRSPDGRAWSGPATFPPPHGLDQPDRPWLAVDPRHPGVVEMANSEGGGNVVLWRSLDHGAHFAGPYTVTGGANGEAGLALSSRPLFDPTADGRVFLLYETAPPAGPIGVLDGAGGSPREFPLTQLWLATSSDAGLTWSNRLVLDAGAPLGHLLAASAIDTHGNLYAAFSLRAAGDTRTQIQFIHSTDHGSTWSAPVPVDAPTKSNVMPALAVSARGAAYLSWYGSSAEDFRADDAHWAEMVAMAPDPLAVRPHFAVAQLSGTSPVHVGGIDTAGTIGSDLGADWGLRDFQSIAVDGCGRAHAAWASDNGTPAAWAAVQRPRCPARRDGHSRRVPAR